METIRNQVLALPLRPLLLTVHFKPRSDHLRTGRTSCTSRGGVRQRNRHHKTPFLKSLKYFPIKREKSVIRAYGFEWSRCLRPHPSLSFLNQGRAFTTLPSSTPSLLAELPAWWQDSSARQGKEKTSTHSSMDDGGLRRTIDDGWCRS